MGITLTITALFFLSFLLIVPRIESRFLIFLLLTAPLINAFADVTTDYFPDGYLTTGALRGLILSLLIVLLSGNIKIKKTTLWIYIFLIYLATLISFSSSSFHTFDEFTKVAISLLMFPLGYYLLCDINKLKRLNHFLMLGVAVIILQVIIAQIFKLGSSEYLEDSFYLGGGAVQITYTLALYVLISPINLPLINSKQKRYVHYLVIIASIIIILLVLRRISIAAILGGYVIYFFISSHKSRILKYTMLSVTILVLAYPLYGNLFEARLQARIESKPSIEQEARVRETFVVANEMVQGDWPQTFFGTELFNSEAYFQKRPEYFYVFGQGRQLHVDYNIILHGAGLIGMLVYIIIHLSLAYELLKQGDSKLRFQQELKAVFWSIFCVTLLISLSGSISGVGYRSASFLYMGSLLGILKSLRKKRVE